jgi:hypothetical protein
VGVCARDLSCPNACGACGEQLLQLEAPELARLLETFPPADAGVVSEALAAEYNSLTESLKMNKPPESARNSTEENGSADGAGASDLPSTKDLPFDEKLNLMEEQCQCVPRHPQVPRHAP